MEAVTLQNEHRLPAGEFVIRGESQQVSLAQFVSDSEPLGGRQQSKIPDRFHAQLISHRTHESSIRRAPEIGIITMSRSFGPKHP